MELDEKGNGKTVVVEVYKTDEDRALGVPPLFKYQVEFFDVSPEITLGAITVSWDAAKESA